MEGVAKRPRFCEYCKKDDCIKALVEIYVDFSLLESDNDLLSLIKTITAEVKLWSDPSKVPTGLDQPSITCESYCTRCKKRCNTYSGVYKKD